MLGMVRLRGARLPSGRNGKSMFGAMLGSICLLLTLLGLPVQSWAACTLNWTVINSTGVQQSYTLTAGETLTCDPTNDGIYTGTYPIDSAVTLPSGAGTIEADNTQYPSDIILYNPSSSNYVGSVTTTQLHNMNNQVITLNLLVVKQPTVSSISPANGSAAGGTSVTISGTYLFGATSVKFGATNASSFNVDSATQITATAPAGSGTVDITVTNAAGTSVTLAADQFTYGNPPVANAVSTTVAHGSSSNNVALNITGGAAASVAVSGAASHGTATASGTTISYTPTASYSGPDSFTYTATNASGTSSAATVTVTVSNATVSYAPSSPVAGAVAVAYSQSLAGASGGTAAYSYTIASGSLPAGVTLASNGTLSGTPTAGGTFNFSVTATDSSTGTGPFSATSGALSLVIAAPTIAYAPSNPAGGTVAVAYSQSLAGASGGTAPYSYAVTAGSLPAGLSLASNGTLSGTPTAGGTFNFTVTATDSSTGTGPYTQSSASLSLTIAAATISYAPSNPAAGTAAVAYSQSLAGASGGTAPYTYAVTSGSLPAGLSLASNGTLSGTPTAAGNFSFVVTATDSSTGTGPYTHSSSLLSLTIGAPTISLSPASLTAATVGSATNQTITASGGTSTYTYAVTAGSLPAGLSLSPGGVLSGTPTAGGTFNFTVTATDSTTGTGSPFTGSRAYSLTVNVPTISVAPASLSAVAAGAAVSGSITASGGISTYSYAVTAGSLPPGVSLSGAGVLSGAATAVGTYNFTVTATDSSTGTGPYTGSRAYAWTVNAPTLTISPVSGSNLSGSALTAYSQAFAPSGGTSPYTYGIVINSGSMPTGLSFSTGTGTLSGTPTAGGTVNFTVTATDATTGAGAPFSVSGTYNLTIGAPTVVVAPVGAIPNPAIGTAYSQTFTASGASAPYGYVVSAGALPAGLTLSAGGVLSGTPTAAGTFNFTVQATDTNNFAGTRAYSITIAAPTIAVAPASLPNGNTSVAYNQTISASGGTAPYSFAVTAGSLPTGLALNPTTGAITGTPSAVNTFNFTVTATDSTTGTGAPFSAAKAYTVIISMQPPVAGAKTANTLSNTPVQIDLAPVITGGVPASIAVAAAPAHGNAVVAGLKVTYTPTAGYFGTDSFTYTATNLGGTSTAATVTITVASPLPPPVVKEVSVSVDADSSNNAVPLSITGTATGVTVSSPAGHGTATASGLTISYTPTAGYAGTDTFTYTAYNDGGVSDRAIVTVTIKPKLALPVAGNTSLIIGANSKANPVALSLSGGAASSVAIATTPAHGTVTVSGTTISYTPTDGYAGADSFTYTASNAAGTSAPATVSISVLALPTAGAVSLTVAANSKANPVALVLGGGAATSVAVAAAPAHGTVTVSGTTASYTPADGYFGADSFTYTASNAGGTSAPATVSVTVSPPPPVVHPVHSNVSINSANNTIQLIIDGGPVISVIIITQPKHGKVTVLGLTGTPNKSGEVLGGPSISYTPDAGYVGPDSFTYTASNAAGMSAAAMVTLDVTPPPPVLGKVSGVVQAGKSVTLDVAAQATGGPFTALVIVTPPAVGSATVQGTGIVYNSPAGFSGVVSIVYALSNAYGASQGTATVTVEGRPDPSKDAEVTGLLSAQADASRRFADAQVNNFSRRMESLHGDGWGESSFGLSIAPIGTGPNRVAKDETAPKPVVAAGTDRAARRLAAKAQAADEADGKDAGDKLASNDDRRELGFWVGGNVDFGQRNGTGNTQQGYSFHTDGVSLGADYRFSKQLSLGVGAGFGRDVSDVGSNGSKSKATNNVLALYGTLRPADKFYVDGLLGYSQLNFDLNRYQTGSSSYATGSRNGRQFFGALIAGYEFQGENWLLSPYGRLDGSSTTLDSYTETATVNALHYEEQTLRSSSASLGLRLEGKYDVGFGKLVPRARIEFRHHFDGADTADLRYADLGNTGLLYSVSPAQTQRDQWLLELGSKLLLWRDLSLSLDYAGGLNNSSGYSHSVRAALEFRF
jgi:uncharacterized protein YhjY with autotransporter beta-barrel domain